MRNGSSISRYFDGTAVVLAVLSVSLCIFPIRAQAERLKLVTPGAGWVVNKNTLYSTADGGANWTDITPVPAGVRRIAVKVESVFLLDRLRGWALISYPEPPLSTPESMLSPAKMIYSLARTDNGGGTWFIAPFTYPKLQDWQEEALAGFYGIYFVDNQHGWIGASFAGLSHPGKLLATEDGGTTWKLVNSPGFSGAFSFVTLQDGWLSGGPDYKLYATHDGAQTWEEVKLSAPAEVGAAIYGYVQEPPVFKDSNRGYVGVQYVGPEPTPSKFVVYSTKDGGRKWISVKVLGEADQYTAGSPIPFSITDSVLHVAVDSSEEGIKVVGVPLSGKLNSDFQISNERALALNFVDASHGLALGVNRNLLFTTDGGATWNDATPWRVLKPPPVHTKPAEPRSEINSEGLLTSTSGATLTAAAGKSGGTHNSIHLGFDIFRVLTTGQMATWWKHSPFYDAYFYLNGAANRGTDPNLNSNWVSTVTSQGWGLIPIWFGRQAPCADNQGLAKFDAATAAAQGTSEADSAAAAAAGLGLSKSIIYKDVETIIPQTLSALQP